MGQSHQSVSDFKKGKNDNATDLLCSSLLPSYIIMWAINSTAATQFNDLAQGVPTLPWRRIHIHVRH